MTKGSFCLYFLTKPSGAGFFYDQTCFLGLIPKYKSLFNILQGELCCVICIQRGSFIAGDLVKFYVFLSSLQEYPPDIYHMRAVVVCHTDNTDM